MKKTIIFDLDGTLLNTLGDLTASVNFAMGEFGFPARSVEEVRNFVGNGVARLIALAVPQGTDDAICEKCLEKFRKHYNSHLCDKTVPYDGITECLETLKRLGYRIAVVSNKPESAVNFLCDKLLHGLYDIAIGDVSYREKKPAPDGIFFALKELDTELREAAFVGDSDVDIATARNAGIDLICVSWGFRDRGVIEKQKVKFIADDADELLKLIEQNF